MDKCPDDSPKQGICFDGDDVKYVSGLSTILVATIQEAKERISQIEYIFCSQLYPDLQSKSRSLQKIYSEAMHTAESTWKKKENNFLLQIEKLKLEKLQVIEENNSLKKEMVKLSKEQEDGVRELIDKQNNQQLKICKLESDLRQKTKEVDEGMGLQKKLLELIQSNASALACKGKEIKEHEEKTNALLAKQEHLENMVRGLKEEIRKKTQEVTVGTELQENLLKKIELQDNKLLDQEHLLLGHEKEKEVLTSRSKCLEEKMGELEDELRKKGEEVEGLKKSSEELLKKSDLSHSDIMIDQNQSQQHEKEKVNDLQTTLTRKSSHVMEGSLLEENLAEQIEGKTSELLSEKKKNKTLIETYKNLKSQYNYLLWKYDLAMKNAHVPSKPVEEADLLSCQQNQVTTDCLENDNLNTAAVGCRIKAEEIRAEFQWEDVKGARSEKALCCKSPCSSKYVASQRHSSEKNMAVAGTKRHALDWRDTRSNQHMGGQDPHDDFLDTPSENIRRNLHKAGKEERQRHSVHDSKKKVCSFSDDETQDMNVDPCPQGQQVSAPSAGKRSYRYVEPVRKKSERENLKGVECRQCKKFYDAVLPDAKSDNDEGNTRNFRCEQHDGVSRHRYQFVPPMTPEGFWNIGFESEM